MKRRYFLNVQTVTNIIHTTSENLYIRKYLFRFFYS